MNPNNFEHILKHELLEDFERKSEKDEWLLSRFIEKYVDTMSASSAFDCINRLADVLVDIEYRKYTDVLLEVLSALVRKSDTTEIPVNLLTNIPLIGISVEKNTAYCKTVFSEILSFYRINASEIKRFDFYVEKSLVRENADFILGCFDGSVFIDFSVTKEHKIKPVRISFDGYGCCEIGSKAEALCLDDSKLFLAVVKSKEIEQTTLEILVQKSIVLNLNYIWKDALEAYCFI